MELLHQLKVSSQTMFLTSRDIFKQAFVVGRGLIITLPSQILLLCAQCGSYGINTIPNNVEVVNLMKIGRTLFWFKDGDEQALDLNERFFAYGTFLNRLLNEHYSGKKLKFININF